MSVSTVAARWGARGRDDLAGGSGPVVLAAVDDRVAWLSGRSSPTRTALSPAEDALLDAAARHGFVPLCRGFPFVGTGPWEPVPLARASVRNARQYFALRHDPATRALVAPLLRPLFATTRSRLLVVCGSLGLELLAAGLPEPGDAPRPRLRVVALGPVAGRVPAGLDVWVAQGRLDPISALGYRGEVRVRPWCGHLGYRGPAVERLVEDACRSPW